MAPTPDRLVYVVGEPGSGKTTMLARATAHLGRVPVVGSPRRDVLHDDRAHIVGVELGGRRDGVFDGVDTLPVSVITPTERWLYRREVPVVLAEGTRLANHRFLRAAVDAGYRTTLMLLDHEDADSWRRERDARNGRPKCAAWVKGQRTLSRRLAEDAPECVDVLAGHPDRLLPVLRGLVEGTVT